jgi:arabinofuranosyltransferase
MNGSGRPASGARGNTGIRVLATIAIVALAAWHVAHFAIVQDDSYIALRVARNWAHAGVPEYNVGTPEWIPTSFAWVSLVAAAQKILPRVSPPVITQVLGGASAVLSLLLLAWGFPQVGLAGLLGALLCASSAIWAAWPLSGLETTLFSMAFVCGVSGLLRLIDSRAPGWALATGAAFGFLTCVRPGGLIPAAVALLAVLLLLRNVTLLACFAAGFLALVVPAVAYLMMTFHSVLPVSYYAKVQGLANLTNGIAYVLGAMRGYHLAELVPLVFVALWSRRLRRPAALALAFVVTWLVWVSVEGGDFMPYYRFVSPLWPLVALLGGMGLVGAAELLERWRPRLRPWWRTALGLALVALAALWIVPTFAGADRASYQSERIEDEMREAIGRYFAAKLPASEWMAVKPAGIIPYYSGMRTIDFFCITDKKAAQEGAWVPGAWVGHQRMNASRIHEIAPRVVILEARLYPLAQLPPPWQSDPNHGGSWLEDPRAKRYTPARAQIVPGYWLSFFVRQ